MGFSCDSSFDNPSLREPHLSIKPSHICLIPDSKAALSLRSESAAGRGPRIDFAAPDCEKRALCAMRS